MKKKGPLRAYDFAVLVLGAILTLAIAAELYPGSGEASRVIIRSPDKEWIFPLDAEEIVTAMGTLGETIVAIHSGQAAIAASPCGGQTCVKTGGLHKNGQWAACLPNGIFLLIEGQKDEAVDAAAW